MWIGLGLLFGAWVALRLGAEAGITYLTAYLVEESLSVDNLFLFVLIFAQTGVPAALQHRALFWGIAGALIMRAILMVSPCIVSRGATMMQRLPPPTEARA